MRRRRADGSAGAARARVSVEGPPASGNAVRINKNKAPAAPRACRYNTNTGDEIQ